MAVQGPIPVEFAQVFPRGLFAAGTFEPVRDFDASKAGGRFVQSKDRQSGLPLWQVDAIDADPAARDKTVRAKVAAADQPVPVDHDLTIADELVIGIGTAELSDSRIRERQRYVGITKTLRAALYSWAFHKTNRETFADHRADRKTWLLETLGITEPDPARYQWEAVMFAAGWWAGQEWAGSCWLAHWRKIQDDGSRAPGGFTCCCCRLARSGRP